MTLDLTKAQPGDTVEFRCGGKAVITVLDVYEENCFFGLDGCPNAQCWKTNGSWFLNEKSPFDIIAIHKKPFDWKDVEYGMAFRGIDGRVYHYIAPHIGNREVWAVFALGSMEYKYFNKCTMSREPEDDKKYVFEQD